MYEPWNNEHQQREREREREERVRVKNYSKKYPRH
jgi:hypothetical protein